MKRMIRFALLGLMATCNVIPEVIAIPETAKEYATNISCKKLHTLKGHKDIVQSMQILKNGLLASGSADTSIRIWSVDGICTKQLNNEAEIIHVEELTDGRVACCSNDGTINFWDNKNSTYTILANLQK